MGYIQLYTCKFCPARGPCKIHVYYLYITELYTSVYYSGVSHGTLLLCTVRGLGSAPASFRVDTAAAEHWQDESRRAGTIVRELRLPALGTAMRRNGACVYLRLPALRGLVYSSALNGCWIHGRNANVRASLDSSSHSGRFCVYRTVVSQENESVSSCSGAEPGSLF